MSHCFSFLTHYKHTHQVELTYRLYKDDGSASGYKISAGGY